MLFSLLFYFSVAAAHISMRRCFPKQKLFCFYLQIEQHDYTNMTCSPDPLRWVFVATYINPGDQNSAYETEYRHRVYRRKIIKLSIIDFQDCATLGLDGEQLVHYQLQCQVSTEYQYF